MIVREAPYFAFLWMVPALLAGWWGAVSVSQNVNPATQPPNHLTT
jgi:hypothetical protein